MSDRAADAARPLSPEAQAVARRWTADVAAAGFLPAGRGRARAALEDLLRQLLDAVHAEPFNPAPGYQIGRRLVELRMSSPAVIGSTIALLAERLPELAGDPPGRRRIPHLMAGIAAGFSAAQRSAAVGAAEDMNRSEKLHWRRVQAGYQEQLRHTQLHDPQSQLPNRAHLLTHLTDRIATASPDARLGVGLLSIGDFAELSDTYGHDDLDLLLAAIGARLQQLAAAHGCFVAHLGDDLFALVVATGCLDDLAKAVDHACHALAASAPGACQPRIRTVEGLVEGPLQGTTAQAWIRDARCALGWARHDRRDRACYDPARAAADLRRHRLTGAMPTALDRGDFMPHFQPIYDLRSRRITGVEALARWRHGGQVLSPHDFIDLAEQSGQICRLGRSMLDQACRQAVIWREQGHRLTLSVNLSPHQLAEPDLPATVAGLLHDTGLPAAALQLEITESAAVEHHHQVINDLAGIGVQIAIDDFGTGYSNLAALSRLPVRCLKLDQQFIRQAPTAQAVTVLRHTRLLCQDLDIEVIAEGIESAGDERLLTDLGYTRGQGFRLARPAPAHTVTQLLARQAPGADP
ncbi:putative bifunctional diguanylate cyclase/phosphodiesterase [Mangrovihabitans endophyticus]|uniref:Diguanylate cyclase (GGDEF) domain-containing protein n=1 Tax=Mangrovihabitans endophyticus TaxID=1751298 RepID=A0A8J3BWV6_9ACTN|nr:GGDEF domain-containing phosphodiesterase [Mangrovihabitans endophyticus]GGK76192.1 hypothetical protein GCM10012284_07690 [Mangrovihabitans endophyticus]